MTTSDHGLSPSADGDGPISDDIPQNHEYRITRRPDIETITPGARIRYDCVPRTGRLPETVGGDSPYQDNVNWFKYRQQSLLQDTRGKDPEWGRPVEKGPLGQFYWSCTWNEAPGRYVIGAEVARAGGDGKDATYCFRSQYVESADRVLRSAIKNLASGLDRVSADEMERRAFRHLANLHAIARRFPITDPKAKQRHHRDVRRWMRYLDGLRVLLAPTEPRRRIPMRAVHFAVADQKQRGLLLFLARLEDDVGFFGGRSQRWVLVDWTDPTDPRFHGTYEGQGDTAKQAIDNALSAWDWENRYPEGKLVYDVPRAVLGYEDRRGFDTNGKSIGEEIADVLGWIAFGTMAVTGALMLLAPIAPLMEVALATSMLSSTGASIISVADRWRAGIFDPAADAFDGLNVVASLFGGAHTWLRGARVQGLFADGAARVFYGARVAADAVQGILVAESLVGELDRLLQDPRLLPEERSRRLLDLFRGATVAGISYFGLRAAARLRQHLDRRARHFSDDDRTRPIGDKLGDLTDPNRTIDSTKPPAGEGEGRQVEQRTTVHGGTTTHPETTESEFAQEYPGKRGDGYWQEIRIGKDQIILEDVDGFYFIATCRKGTLTIQIKTIKYKGEAIEAYAKRLRASELYPRMYRHFEAVNNRVERLVALWDEKNFEDAKGKYDELIRAGKPHQEAVDGAVVAARSYKKYHEPEGLTELIRADPLFETDNFEAVFVRKKGR